MGLPGQHLASVSLPRCPSQRQTFGLGSRPGLSSGLVSVTCRPSSRAVGGVCEGGREASREGGPGPGCCGLLPRPWETSHLAGEDDKHGRTVSVTSCGLIRASWASGSVSAGSRRVLSAALIKSERAASPCPLVQPARAARVERCG